MSCHMSVVGKLWANGTMGKWNYGTLWDYIWAMGLWDLGAMGLSDYGT